MTLCSKTFNFSAWSAFKPLQFKVMDPAYVSSQASRFNQPISKFNDLLDLSLKCLV